jgi:hypothetical protein
MRHVNRLILNGMSGVQLETLMLELLKHDSDTVLRILDGILGNAGVADGISASVFTQAEEYCNDNKKVAAIKIIREETGWGLKEAKDWVEDKFYNLND